MSSKDFYNKKIPAGIPEYKSKLAKDTEAVNCEFKVGKFSWSLSLTSDDRYLYVVPSLVEPQSSIVKFALAIMVLNSQNNVINTPILGELGYSGCSSGKKGQKWEVLKFGETNFDYFASMVYGGSLKLFVEMTVFYDTHGA